MAVIVVNLTSVGGKATISGQRDYLVPAEAIEDLEPGGGRDYVAISGRHTGQCELTLLGRQNRQTVAVRGRFDDPDTRCSREHSLAAAIRTEGLAYGAEQGQWLVVAAVLGGGEAGS